MKLKLHTVIGITMAAIGSAFVSLLAVSVSMAVAAPVSPVSGQLPEHAVNSTSVTSTVVGAIIIVGIAVLSVVFFTLSRTRRVALASIESLPSEHEPDQMRKAA